MTRASIALLSSAAMLLAQTSTGTIRGVVRDALTGTPMGGVWVHAGRTTVQTDPNGSYTIPNLPPGDVQITIAGETAQSIGPKDVSLAPGQDLTVDLPVQALGRISGVVTDAEGKPAGNVMVTAVTREYSAGSVRYIRWHSTMTNERGEYGVVSTAPVSAPRPRANEDQMQAMSRSLLDLRQDMETRARTASVNLPAGAMASRGLSVESGRAFLLVASKGRGKVVDAVESDPEARPPIPHTTWYIGSHTPEGALPLTLSPGERRERVDIRLSAGPGYCIVGTLRPDTLGAQVQITFSEAQAEAQGILGYLQFAQTIEKDPAKPTTARICGLSPGEYRLTSSVTNAGTSFPLTFRSQAVTISDRDVKISLDGDPPVRLSPEISWDASPPQELPESTLTLRLRPLNRRALGDEALMAKIAVSRHVEDRGRFDRLLIDEYELQVNGIPSGAYVKDVISGGRSILHQPFHSANGDLRVILAHDGATITAQVSDGDGKPVSDSWVVVMPASAASETALADSMVWGRSDPAGTWTSPALAPGKYLVLATTAPVDRSVEAVERLYRARNRASEADLAPGSSVMVKLNSRVPN